MGNFDRITTNAKPRTVELTLPVDPNDRPRLVLLQEQLQKAKSQVDLAELAATTTPSDAATAHLARMTEHVAEAEAAIAASGIPTYTLHLRQLEVTRIEDLRFSHRPTAKQKERSKVLAGDARAVPGYNEETYPPTLLSEACTQITWSDDPDHPTEALSVEMAAAMIAKWPQGNLLHVVAVIEALAAQPTFVGELGKG